MASPPRFPWRGAEDAPEFSGLPHDLNHYFSDIEYLLESTGAKYTDQQTIQRCIYYLDYYTADLWESVTAATWEEFKDEIRSLYPGSTTSGGYRLQDLECVVVNRRKAEITTVADLGEYLRDFVRIASDLEENGRIGSYDRSRLFIRGFTAEAEERLRFRLQVLHPMQHPDDPYPLEDVRTAAEWILPATLPHREKTATIAQAPTTEPIPIPTPVYIPAEKPLQEPVRTSPHIPVPSTPPPRLSITVSGTSPDPITVSGTRPEPVSVYRTSPPLFASIETAEEPEEDEKREENTTQTTQKDYRRDLDPRIKYKALMTGAKVVIRDPRAYEREEEEEDENEDYNRGDVKGDVESNDDESEYGEQVYAVYLKIPIDKWALAPADWRQFELREVGSGGKRWEIVRKESEGEWAIGSEVCGRLVGESGIGLRAAPIPQSLEYSDWKPWEPG